MQNSKMGWFRYLFDGHPRGEKWWFLKNVLFNIDNVN